jgi:hypothetical protein
MAERRRDCEGIDNTICRADRSFYPALVVVDSMWYGAVRSAAATIMEQSC